MYYIFFITCILVCFVVVPHNDVYAESMSQIEKIDLYLINTGAPEKVVKTMTEHEKSTIYKSLISLDEPVQYVSHSEELVHTNENSKTTRDIPNMKFSVTAFEYTNNLMRHMIYPHYEWKYGAIDAAQDKFSFCLSYNAWDILSTPTLKIPTASTNIRPADLDFSGASFDTPNIGAYEGTATVIARRTSNLLANQMLLGYVADKTSGGASIGVTFGPMNLSYTGQLGRVDTVTEMLPLTW